MNSSSLRPCTHVTTWEGYFHAPWPYFVHSDDSRCIPPFVTLDNGDGFRNILIPHFGQYVTIWDEILQPSTIYACDDWRRLLSYPMTLFRPQWRLKKYIPHFVHYAMLEQNPERYTSSLHARWKRRIQRRFISYWRWYPWRNFISSCRIVHDLEMVPVVNL